MLVWLFPRQNLVEMWQATRSIDPAWIVAALALVFADMILRALRWCILLGRGTGAGLSAVFSALMIGYLANNVLPARGGDLVRVYVFGTRSVMARSRILATVTVERVLDMAMIVIVVGVLAAASPIPPWMRQGGVLLASGTTASVAGLAILRIIGNRLVAFLLRPLSTRAPALASRFARMGHEFISGLDAVQQPAIASLFLVYTAGIWALEIAIVLSVARAFGLALSPADAVILMLFSLFSSLIPALPGQFGLYEFAIVMGLDYAGHSGPAALPYALTLHLVLIAGTTVLGLACLLVSGVSLLDAKRADRPNSGP